MKKTITLLLFSIVALQQSFAQCGNEPSKNKVLLLGDSWGYFMNFEQTITKELKKWGHSGYKYVTNGNLVVNGADTYDFLDAGTQQQIVTILGQNPDIEIIHLSIGGNDFLGDWKKSMTQPQIDTMKMGVMERLDSIVRFLQLAKPGVDVMWSGYCYTNFTEPITQGPFPFQGSSHPFYGTWNDMEQPSFLEINTLLKEISMDMVPFVANHPKMHFVPETGILQYTIGQTSPICCNIQPQTTYAPGTVSMPWGDVNYPSPISGMRDYVLTKDCFHLSPQGYSDFIGYQMQKFYQKYFMDDLYLLAENNSQTGSVSSTGSVSDTLFLGGNASAEYATVLSFNTTSMPDTTLAKASLFLRRSNSTGTNPITGSLQVKVKNGNFGTIADVEAVDFNASGDASGNPCLYGSNANGEWVRFDLPSSLLPYINKNAATQFILSAPGVTNGLGYFTNASDPDFAPVLNLTYSNPLGVKDPVIDEAINIYPNPTSGMLTISTNGLPIQKVFVTDLTGKTILNLTMINENSVDISSLSAGMYLLHTTTLNGNAVKRIVKN